VLDELLGDRAAAAQVFAPQFAPRGAQHTLDVDAVEIGIERLVVKVLVLHDDRGVDQILGQLIQADPGAAPAIGGQNLIEQMLTGTVIEASGLKGLQTLAADLLRWRELFGKGGIDGVGGAPDEPNEAQDRAEGDQCHDKQQAEEHDPSA